MFAVIQTGGKQYKVALNSLLRVERLDHPVGERITLDSVKLLVRDDAGIVTDAAALAAVKVVAEIAGHDREKKIRVYKKKRKKGFERVQGHRQHYTLLRIHEIQAQ